MTFGVNNLLIFFGFRKKKKSPIVLNRNETHYAPVFLRLPQEDIIPPPIKGSIPIFVRNHQRHQTHQKHHFVANPAQQIPIENEINYQDLNFVVSDEVLEFTKNIRFKHEKFATQVFMQFCMNKNSRLGINSFVKGFRPNWLKNPQTGRNLELDVFLPSYRLALEYNGAQHYKYIEFFQKNKENFHAQKHRDHFKAQICSSKEIIILNIPYTLNLKQIQERLCLDLEAILTEDIFDKQYINFSISQLKANF